MRFWVWENDVFLKDPADGEKSIQNDGIQADLIEPGHFHLRMLHNIDYTKLNFLTTIANNDVN